MLVKISDGLFVSVNCFIRVMDVGMGMDMGINMDNHIHINK